MLNRREFVKMTVATGIVAGIGLLRPRRAWAFSQSPMIPKFQQALPGLGPSGIPLATKSTSTFGGRATDVYYLSVGEYTQQIPGLPNPTTFWGYADVNGPHRYLGGVIVATRGTPVLLNVTNRLPNHQIIPIDKTLMAGDGKTVGELPLNRIVTHLHGGFTPWISDGTPFQWFTPSGIAGSSFHNVPGTNPPLGTATYYYPMEQSARLVWYHDHAMGITRTNAYSGIASALVITDAFESYLLTQNLLPDLVGVPLIVQDKTFLFRANDPHYPIRGAPDGSLWYPWQYEKNSLPNGQGRWDYGPDSGATVTGPLPAVSCVPEFFADTTMVNGQPYPVLSVTEGTFRFRLLNGSQARFYHLNLYQEADSTGEPDMSNPGPALFQFGTEGGFLPGLVVHPNGIRCPLDLVTDPTGNTADPTKSFNLLLAPAERAELLIDFTGLGGKSFVLYNDAPGPFPGGDPRNDYYTGDPDFTSAANNSYGLSGGAPTTQAGQGPNTRTIMKIVVGSGSNAFGPLSLAKQSALSQALAQNFKGGNPVAPQQPPLIYQGSDAATPGPVPYTGTVSRRLTLNEDFDELGRLIQREGTFTSLSKNSQGNNTWGLAYESAPTETPTAGATEVWEIYNLTGDTHPIHFHLVNVQLIQRCPFSGDPASGITLGAPRPPDENELGWKETVRMNPGEVTTVMIRFDLPKVPFPVFPSVSLSRGNLGNEYVWHCHILEHEEHDMMRPLVVNGPCPLATVPETQAATKPIVSYQVVNGTPPYTVASSDKRFPPIPPSIPLNGGTFFVLALNDLGLTNPVTYTVTDRAGNRVSATLTKK